MKIKVAIVFLMIFLASCQQQSFQAEAVEYGLAQRYPRDVGIKSDPAVILASNFETSDWYKSDFAYTGYLSEIGHQVISKTLTYTGNGALEYQSIKGQHLPNVMDVTIPNPQDTIFLRWYRKYETGYDFTCQSKTNGVYALNPPDQVIRDTIPNGRDKFSEKLQIWKSGTSGGVLKFYTYNPEQANPAYGDTLSQNIGTPLVFTTGRWYGIEIMLKANTPGVNDGEMKLWIDGTLKGWYKNMHFRDTTALKINQLNITAYVGGSCTASKDQKVWDDNLVLATEYIGPLVLATPTPTNTPTLTNTLAPGHLESSPQHNKHIFSKHYRCKITCP